jgi:hypothetical protein
MKYSMGEHDACTEDKGNVKEVYEVGVNDRITSKQVIEK